MDNNLSTIMVDLDSLFDTRLGTLITYMYDDLVTIFSRDLYRNRLDDSFNKQIDKDLFYSYYDKRDKKVLFNSTLSLLPDIIQDFIVNIQVHESSSPYNYEPHLVINCYPYDLTDDEVNNISEGVFQYFKGKISVELVNMNLESITTRFIRENVTVLVMYEYHRWLDIQTNLEGFNKLSCADTTLIAPRMFFNKLPDTQAKSDEIFKHLETISKPFINLELLPSMFFSTYLRSNEPLKKTAK